MAPMLAAAPRDVPVLFAMWAIHFAPPRDLGRRAARWRERRLNGPDRSPTPEARVGEPEGALGPPLRRTDRRTARVSPASGWSEMDSPFRHYRGWVTAANHADAA